MVLHEQNKACYSCGTIGFGRNTCTQCPCKYCKGDHPVVRCPNVAPCQNCGKKGHKTEKCKVIRTTSQGLPEERQFQKASSLKRASSVVDTSPKKRIETKVFLGSSNGLEDPMGRTDAPDTSSPAGELTSLPKQENAPESTLLKPEGFANVQQTPTSDHEVEDRKDQNRVKESDVAFLDPLCKEALQSDKPEPRNSMSSQQRDPAKVQGFNWRNEKKRFRHEKYVYRVNPSPRTGASIEFCVHHCRMLFLKSDDLGDGTIYLKIELETEKLEHPQFYATQALPSDPARRLAFKVRWKTSSGTEVERYQRCALPTAPFRANTFLDVLIDGKPVEEIAQTPRRYINFRKNSKIPPGLEQFIGGACTSKIR